LDKKYRYLFLLGILENTDVFKKIKEEFFLKLEQSKKMRDNLLEFYIKKTIIFCLD
jgi:hypothetical protein